MPSYEASATALKFVNSNATRLPDTHRLIASYTAGIQAQLQERTPTGRLANEFDLMLTQRVLIQTLPPATAAGDTSGPITAAAQVDTLRARTTNTHKQQNSESNRNHYSHIKVGVFCPSFCTNIPKNAFPDFSIEAEIHSTTRIRTIIPMKCFSRFLLVLLFQLHDLGPPAPNQLTCYADTK